MLVCSNFYCFVGSLPGVKTFARSSGEWILDHQHGFVKLS